jgi:uncharacterized protein YjbI with pentapeptide repeats
VAKAGGRTAPRLAKATTPHAELLGDEEEVDDATLTGEIVGDADIELVALMGCRLEGVMLTGRTLRRWRFVDCLIVDSDLSGVVLDRCSLTRVEVRDCRLSGFQGAGGRYADVGFVGCRIDGANFRMSRWERSGFDHCDLSEADFGNSQLPGTQLLGCDLTGIDLSKCDLTGASLRGSTLERLQGAESLRGVTISSDQIVPAGLAVFGAMKITISDGDENETDTDDTD